MKFVMKTICKIRTEKSQPIQAGIYLLFYTLLAKLALLVGIFYIYHSDNLIFL